MTPTILDARTQNLVTHLHRGADWAFVWTPNAGEDGQRKLSAWSRTGEPLIVPQAWRTGKNLYFGVHPSHTRRQEYERSTNATVGAINCFPVEFDGKDYTDPTNDEIQPLFSALRADPTKAGIKDNALWKEATNHAKEVKFATQPTHYKALALAHIQALPIPPSVIVDSGGGYQCYYLLRDPFAIRTEEQREEARRWIKLFVAHVGGDPGAAQLGQVFRLPGSRNYKKRYAPTFPLVYYVKFDLDLLYDLEKLLALLPAPEPTHRTPSPQLRQAEGSGSVIDAYNAAVAICDALASAGYIRQGQRWRRPGGASASVIIFEEDNTSYHHSSSDPLFSEHSRSPFDVFCMFEHDGDVKAAVRAAAQLLGLERPAKQPEEGHDWRPLLEAIKYWVRTTPAALQGATRRTDGRNVKLATAILHRMQQRNTTTLRITQRTLGLDAGLGKDAVNRGLEDIARLVFRGEAENKAVTIITLDVDFCLRQMRQIKGDDPYLSHLTQANETDEYQQRMGTDPFLTGTSHRVKEQAQQAAILEASTPFHEGEHFRTGEEFHEGEIRFLPHTFREWLATFPKALGEAVLLIATTLGPGGSGTVAETMEETGRTISTIRNAYRKLEQAGLAESEQENRRSPKIYHLSPDLWKKVEEMTPTLRTYGLAAERRDNRLRDSQQWAAKQLQLAEQAGDMEAAQQAKQRFNRLADQRMKETLPEVYPQMAPADRALLAWDVRTPRRLHPATERKRQTERAEEQRQQQWDLIRQLTAWRDAGTKRDDAIRLLVLAGYCEQSESGRQYISNEALGAVNRVWSQRYGEALNPRGGLVG